MAIGLQNTDNVDAPGGDYPYGKVRDKSTGIEGTPANTKTLGDFHQWFARLLDQADLAANELPDNDYSGFQYFEALLKIISKRVGIFSKDDAINGESSTNFNDYVWAGTFQVTSSFSNKPTNLGATALLTVSGYGAAVTQKLLDLSNSAEYSRTWNGSAWSAWSVIRLAQKQLNIGDWNMNSTNTISVAHGLADHKQIRDVSVIIRPDVDGSRSRLEYNSGDGVMAGSVAWASANIVLQRVGGGFFDNAAYDATSYNRGFITIFYDPS